MDKQKLILINMLKLLLGVIITKPLHELLEWIPLVATVNYFEHYKIYCNSQAT